MDNPYTIGQCIGYTHASFKMLSVIKFKNSSEFAKNVNVIDISKELGDGEHSIIFVPHYVELNTAIELIAESDGLIIKSLEIFNQ